MNSRQFSDRINGARAPYTAGGWWSGKCPAHDDSTPSLGWRDGRVRIVIKCQAGCALAEVLAELWRSGTWTPD